MNEPKSAQEAVRAAFAPLTHEQRHAFSDELRTRSDNAPASISGQDAWRVANNRLCSDPLDPIGEAWLRFATGLLLIDARGADSSR